MTLPQSEPSIELRVSSGPDTGIGISLDELDGSRRRVGGLYQSLRVDPSEVRIRYRELETPKPV